MWPLLSVSVTLSGPSALQHVTAPHSFLRLNNIPPSGQTTFYLSIHPLTDMWVLPTFRLLWQCCCISGGETAWSWWLFNILGKRRSVFQSAAPFSIHARGFQWLHILLNTFLTILVGVKCCVIVVLTCISLVTNHVVYSTIHNHKDPRNDSDVHQHRLVE